MASGKLDEALIEAIEIFDDILSENSFFTQASIFKAWSHLFLGDLELTIKIFNHIPVTMDESITFYGGLAFAYTSRDEPTGSRNVCKTSGQTLPRRKYLG